MAISPSDANHRRAIWYRGAVKPRAFLRWAGSKKQILPVLAAFWRKSFCRYVEPFAGSSRLYFEIQPERALLSDKNEELIRTYQVLRDHPIELFRKVTAMPTDQACYYRARAQNPARLCALDRASRFIYLNRYCFNGIYRTNLRGEFNVPYCKRTAKAGALPGLELFCACAQLLLTSELRCWDFGTALRHTCGGDFVYLDPPYVTSTRRVFREYGPAAFSTEDLARLAAHLKRMDRRGVAFVLSYADCREGREAFGKWNIRRLRVRRHVAGFSAARRHAREMIVTNISG